MSWSHPDGGHQAVGKMESQHKSGKPQTGQPCVGPLTRAQLCQGTQAGPPHLLRGILDRDPNTHTLRNRGCWQHPLPLCSWCIPSPMQRPFPTELEGASRACALWGH